MVLSIIVILAVGLVTYIHYVQGFFSGFISLVLAVFAAAMAMSNYESMAYSISGGKFNDQSQGVCLIGLFILIYIAMRVLFDSTIPGNIRLPAVADKIGGAVCGFIAGTVALGIVVIAAQSMPFGPSLGGYARFTVKDEYGKSVPGPTGRYIDRMVYEEMKEDNLKGEPNKLILPVDDVVVGLTKMLSAGGSLDAGKPFASVHPDLLQEYFGQRIGLQPGAKHTASNKTTGQVDIEAVTLLPSVLPQVAAEFKELRDPLKGNLTAGPGEKLLAVTVLFKSEASDDNEGTAHNVRVSPGSVRLVANVGGTWTNYFPVGSLQDGKAWINKPDDFMFVNLADGEKGVHFLFKVDESVVMDGKTARIAPGTFIEVKRLVKLPLEDSKVTTGMPPQNPKYYPMRKVVLWDEKAQPVTPVARTDTPTVTPTPTPTPETTPTPTPNPRTRPTETPTTPTTPVTPTPTVSGDGGWGESPLETPVLTAGSKLPVGVNTGTADADADILGVAVSGHTTGKKFDDLTIDASAAEANIKELPKGGYAVDELFVPAGKRMVQVKLTPKAKVDSWAWATALGDYTVVDSAGAAHKPNGVLAMITQAGGAQKLLASYKATAEVATAAKTEGVVGSVTLLYLIPGDGKASAIVYKGAAGGIALEK